MVGWQFDVLSSLTLDGLGWFDAGQNGMAMAHPIGIWAPDGTLLGSVTVPSGTSAALDGQFRMVPVAPFQLSPGAGYIVGGLNFAANTERIAENVVQSVDPRISYSYATFSLLDSGFTRPTHISNATTGFYGPSFSVVPEPSLFLFVSGAAAAWFLCSRRPHQREMSPSGNKPSNE
jgi:hypothetical protein